VARRTTVHNFEVADYHSYYVSASKVLVHNNGPCDGLAKKSGKDRVKASKKTVDKIRKRYN